MAITNAQVTSAIKRINDRLKQFEQQGWTYSYYYKDLISFANRLSQPLTQTKSKNGKTYSRIGVTPKKATELDKQLILQYGSKSSRKTIGNAKKQKAQFTSAIKRINYRLKQFEQQGWTQSQNYKDLVNFANRLSQPLSQTKSINGGVTYSRIGVPFKNATELDVELIIKYGSKSSRKTLENAKKQAKREFNELIKQGKIIKPETKEDKENILKNISKASAELHDFIVQNKDTIYLNSELSNIVHKSHKSKGRMTPQEKTKLLEMYNNAEWFVNGQPTEKFMDVFIP